MSYSEILTLLNETHQNMEQRRTQFHDSKKSITRAETLLTGFKKEKVDYKKLDLQEAQSAFDSGDYESSSDHANRVAEVAEIDLAELKKVKLERESLDGLLDAASKEGLNVDKAIIKGLNKSIKNCDFSNANKKIIELKESIESELSDIRVVAAAPKEWKELGKIDKDAEVEDYCENGVWDRDGLRADLKLMREKLGIKVKASPAPKAAAPPNKSGGASKMQGLRELLEMKKEGLIDDGEFKQLKKEILG